MRHNTNSKAADRVTRRARREAAIYFALSDRAAEKFGVVVGVSDPRAARTLARVRPQVSA